MHPSRTAVKHLEIASCVHKMMINSSRMSPVFHCFLISWFTTFAVAQSNAPKLEAFGGYSYLHIDTQGVTGSTLDTACNAILGAGTCPPGSFGVHPSANGWNASAQYNVTHFLGIKGDFSGHYNTPVTISSQIANALAQAGITGLLIAISLVPSSSRATENTRLLHTHSLGRTMSAQVFLTLPG